MIPTYKGNVTIIPKGFDERCTKDPTVKLDFLDKFKQHWDSSEKELWFEVLQVALTDYQIYYSEKNYRKFNEVFDWIFNGPKLGEAGYGKVGTFQFCCDHLDIDNKFLQKELVKWTKKEIEYENEKFYNQSIQVA